MYTNLFFIDMETKIPQSLKIEHEELHDELRKAIKYGGKVGDAAKAVANVLHDHFIKEEEYALPPLGLLSFLSQGKFTAEMKEIVTMTDKLKLDLSNMVEEHRQIVKELDNLVEVANKENKMEIVHFAEKLKLHAKNEEEVLYPAAILVGEYLKLQN
jgi:hemerythrin-like domain-containing protein